MRGKNERREQMSIPVYTPDLTGNEIQYAEDAIRSGWISSIGPYVNRFEQALAKETGATEAISVCNGTVALHLALHCLDIGPGEYHRPDRSGSGICRKSLHRLAARPGRF